MHGRDRPLVERLKLLHEFHFELAETATVDDLCRTLVDRGRTYVGVDRMGLWFFDRDDPEQLHGSFGIDEQGNVRDERKSSIDRDTEIYDDSFFQRKIPYRMFRNNAIYDDKHNVVGTSDLVVAPMWNGNETIGALSADNLLSGEPIRDEDAQLIALTARIVGHLVTIKRTEEQLKSLATVDELTGMLNRRAGLAALEQQIALARRADRDLTIAFVDLDGLKTVNDTQGHASGDQFILEIVRALVKSKRASDLVCRMGGDEFMLVLPDTSITQAQEVLSRLEQNTLQSETLRSIASPPWYSHGLASLDSVSSGLLDEDADISLEDEATVVRVLIQTADESMYRQKKEHQGQRP